jgi:hypothetical protein
MIKEEILVRYKLDEIMKYKKKNNMMTENLKKYCMNSNTSFIEIRTEFQTAIDVIINSRLNNEDPSNILMKQNITNILNKINSKNFTECLNNIKSIKCSGMSLFKLLSTELIQRSMNDPVATQIFEPNDNDIYITDINGRIVKELYSQTTLLENDTIVFGSMFIKDLRKQFLEFMDSSKKFDNFNQHRNNNYLGFMNFLGVLHNLEVLPKELTLSVIKTPLNKLVFNKDWDIVESTHAYTGIIKFVKQILFAIEKYKNKYDIKYLEAIKQVLMNFEKNNELIKKFRLGTILKHNKFIEKIENEIKLREEK